MAYTRFQMKLSVVIPTLDEAANISVLLERLSETPGIYEVVVADGGSADRTPNILRSSMYRLVLGESSRAGPSPRHRRPDPAAEEHTHRRPRARKRLRGVPRRQQRRRLRHARTPRTQRSPLPWRSLVHERRLLQETVDKAHALGLKVYDGKLHYNVDTPEDLVHLKKELAVNPEAPLHTAEFLRSL